MGRNFYKCPICGNEDPKSIGYLNGKPYCRKCISFRGEEVIYNQDPPKKAPLFISYELSKEQKILSDKLLSNYKNGINSLVHAVCGAGKTEIVLQVIQYALKCGDKVAFAVPRRDVVIELYDRFASFYKNNKVEAIYGGHHQLLKADLLILTTHQLYRYKNYFDLLIIDEIDAFPFNGNDILNIFFIRSIKGHYIMMSATPSEKVIQAFKKEGFDLLELNHRFHGHPLPVPEVIVKPKTILKMYLIRYLKMFKKEGKQVFLFCPTINESIEIYRFVSIFVSGGDYVNSKKEDRNETIIKFKKGITRYIVTTAVLERGVTIKDLQVIVYHADSGIYDSHALVQISGRVGRKKDAPTGKVIFLCEEKTRDIQKCIDEINYANKDL